MFTRLSGSTIRSTSTLTGVKISVTNEKQFGLSVLESEILVTIDNIGWYAYLWFPVVYREVLTLAPTLRTRKYTLLSGV
jgi:hypothetical protein